MSEFPLTSVLLGNLKFEWDPEQGQVLISAPDGEYAQDESVQLVPHTTLSGISEPAWRSFLLYAARVFVDGTGQVVWSIHDPSVCADRHCVIHNPSDHSMRDFSTHWRWDRRIMERICPHGVGHPDPDDNEYQKSLVPEDVQEYIGIHGCDGCCLGH